MFDLDGTLTYHDTLGGYLVHALREHPRRAAGLWVLPFALAAFAVDRDHGRLKSRLIRALLGGLERAEIARLTAGFLDRHLGRMLRPGALAALEAHRRRGDYLVILSASTDSYVPAIGARLGVDEVICTELCWRDGRLDGALATPNRRGAEKTRCIAALRTRHPAIAVTAYGNAASDIDHLRQVDHGVLVNGSAAARREAIAAGLATDDWP